MTDPYFLETLVAGDLLPFEQPFVVAHEWSHLAGYADEGDANFVGWLTCLGGSDADHYSGWLLPLWRDRSGRQRGRWAGFAGRLAPGPTADRRAIADRVRRQINPAALCGRLAGLRSVPEDQPRRPRRRELRSDRPPGPGRPIRTRLETALKVKT